MRVGDSVDPRIMSNVWLFINYDSQEMVSIGYLMLARRFIICRVDDSINSLNQKS